MTLQNGFKPSNSRNSILLIGPVSYVGGVSVHIKRLKKILIPHYRVEVIDDSPFGISVEEYNIRNLKAFFQNIKLLRDSGLVHIHSGNWLLRIFLVVLCTVLKKKTIVSLHSFRLSGIKKKLSRLALKSANKIICVNDDIKSEVNLPNKTIVKEAFLPPVNFDIEELPREVSEFIKESGGRVLLCANASKLTRWQGKDLYGLDLCVEVAKLAKKNNFKLSIIFIIGTADFSDPFLIKAFADIKIYSLESFIKIHPKSLSFIKLIQNCDIVLRPTLSDGDALTIREALFLGKRVIASDIVKRPVGAELYKTGDANSLYSAILNATEATKPIKGEKTAQLESYENFYLDIYKQCNS